MNEDKLSTLLQPVLGDHGLELDRLEVTSVGRRRLIRITVDGDGPNGTGPLLDDITSASQAISRMLDDANYGGSAPYTLEVSSRGVSKPLTEPKHFRRNTGRLVKVQVDGVERTGRILSLEDDNLSLDVNGSVQVMKLSEVRKAVVQVELNRPAPDLDDEEN